MAASVPGAIVAGGLVAGAIDITYACAFSYFYSGVTPDRVGKYVASGWVGIDAARAGGMEMVALGFASHFAIMLVIAAVYVLASRVLPILARQPLIFGPLYGIGVYLAMNFLVVPLSHAPDPRFALWPTLTGVIVHMFGIGLVIAWFASRVRREI